VQAANYAFFSAGYALELEEKLVERDAEIAALRKQLEETNGELAVARRTEEDNAEAMEAMRQLLESEELVRQRAEHALERYKRWKDSRRSARRT
jgi:methylthioribose-1-phosphate isomerase